MESLGALAGSPGVFLPIEKWRVNAEATVLDRHWQLFRERGKFQTVLVAAILTLTWPEKMAPMGIATSPMAS